MSQVLRLGHGTKNKLILQGNPKFWWHNTVNVPDTSRLFCNIRQINVYHEKNVIQKNA